MTEDPAFLLPATRRVPARRHGLGGPRAGETPDRDETVAEEVPVALVYNGRSFAVMMASPADLADFALGFSLTEGVVETESEVLGIEVVGLARGYELRVEITESRALALRSRQRTLAGRTGCGLCGVDSIAEALRPVPRVAGSARVPEAAIQGAVAAFGAHQPLNGATGATHAAAFAALDGRILLAREDIGRHNALDKLIGALAAAGIDRGAGFVVVSSRCSYEMVHKTCAAGIVLIVSVSAPTGLAVDLAEKVGVGLAAFARDGRFTTYAAHDRIADRPESG